jgi:hypothetical protein
MAACTALVSPNASTDVTDRLPAKTSMKGLIDGTAPITLGKGLKAAFVTVNFDGGTYASGGVAINLLDVLYGWTAVLGSTVGVFTDTVVKLAQYNPATDKVIVNIMTTGAEHAAAALDGTVTLLVFGY